jgi:hypothetical protein
MEGKSNFSIGISALKVKELFSVLGIFLENLTPNVCEFYVVEQYKVV